MMAGGVVRTSEEIASLFGPFFAFERLEVEAALMRLVEAVRAEYSVVGYVSEYTADTLAEARMRGHGEVKQIASKPARSVVVPVYRHKP